MTIPWGRSRFYYRLTTSMRSRPSSCAIVCRAYLSVRLFAGRNDRCGGPPRRRRLPSSLVLVALESVVVAQPVHALQGAPATSVCFKYNYFCAALAPAKAQPQPPFRVRRLTCLLDPSARPRRRAYGRVCHQRSLRPRNDLDPGGLATKLYCELGSKDWQTILRELPDPRAVRSLA